MTEEDRAGRSRISVHLQSWRSTQQRDSRLQGDSLFLCHARPMPPNDVFQATRLPFDPGSPTAVRARARGGHRPTWRGFGARFPTALQINRTLKPTLLYCALLRAERRDLSLSGGASISI